MQILMYIKSPNFILKNVAHYISAGQIAIVIPLLM